MGRLAGLVLALLVSPSRLLSRVPFSAQHNGKHLVGGPLNVGW